MSIFCPWCHLVMPDEPDGPVTQGICPNCAADLQLVPEAFDRFLETLRAPVLVVDGQGRVMGTNTTAAAFVRMEPADMVGKLGGEVLSCANAGLPGGCGHTIHCTGCAIRRAFEHTAKTGEPIRHAIAFAQRRGVDGPLDAIYDVSTERLGPLVLVQIEDVGPDQALSPLATSSS